MNFLQNIGLNLNILHISTSVNLGRDGLNQLTEFYRVFCIGACSSDDHRTKVDGDFMPAPSGIMGSRRSRKRALSEASASQDDSARRTYKTG